MTLVAMAVTFAEEILKISLATELRAKTTRWMDHRLATYADDCDRVLQIRTKAKERERERPKTRLNLSSMDQSNGICTLTQ